MGNQGARARISGEGNQGARSGEGNQGASGRGEGNQGARHGDSDDGSTNKKSAVSEVIDLQDSDDGIKDREEEKPKSSWRKKGNDYV